MAEHHRVPRLGLVLVLGGFFGFGTYITSDKEHLHETVFLYASLALIGAGAHMISRAWAKGFLSDIGRFLPWGKKAGTTETPTTKGGEGGGES
jgi:hypothetical protein